MSITWDAPSVTCGDVYYNVSVSQSPSEENATSFEFVDCGDRCVNVTGLNNDLPDVTVIVTATDRVGRVTVGISVLQLLISESKLIYVTVGTY